MARRTRLYEPLSETYDFEAPPEAVFDAWTHQNEIWAWWAARTDFPIMSWTGDLRPGGKWSCWFREAGGAALKVKGVFLVVERPSRLYFTWDSPWDDDPPTVIHFDLRPEGAGARLFFKHTDFASAEAIERNAGWWNAPMAMVRAYLNAKREDGAEARASAAP
jgi:uncharacterized protein YndB with AHSA1/START domain